MFYWLKIFEAYWADEVDEVYIAVSQPVHPTAFGYTRAVLETNKKIKVILTNKNWPDSVNEVAKQITGDTVILLHDDTFIFKKGVVDKYASLCEETGKVVTPTQGIYAPPDIIEEMLKKKYPNQLPITGPDTDRKDYSFYCYFTFLPYILFDKTNKDFGDWKVKRGEYSPDLDFTPLTRDLGADTNFKFTLDLLRAGADFISIPYPRLAYLYNLPDFLKDFDEMINNKTEICNPTYGWGHIQTLSYHIGGLYYDLEFKIETEKIRGGKLDPLILNEAHNRFIPAARASILFKLAWIAEFIINGRKEYSGMQKYYNYAVKELDYVRSFFMIPKEMLLNVSKKLHNIIWPGASVEANI
jgi:hypothetical protein